jgi:N-acetylglucosamine repressor
VINTFSSMRDLRVTEKLIFRVVYQHGPLTKNQILGYVDGSLSTVQRMLNRLVKENIILENDSDQETGGRKPSLYTVNSKAYFSVGAYITWEAYGIGICSIDGTILKQDEGIRTKDVRPSDVVAFFKRSLDKYIEELGLEKSRLLGIGLSATGPILKEKGILYHPHHIKYPQWDVVPIKDLLEMATNMKVTMNNLASTALLGEFMNNTIPTNIRSAYIIVDIGVGTDVFIPGMLGLDKNDTSGNLGHMIINLHGEKCTCGNRGCLETYVSLEALYSRFGAIFPEIWDNYEEKCAQDGSEMVWQTSPELCKINQLMARIPLEKKNDLDMLVEEISDALGAGIKNFINLTRPSAIFLGGRVTSQLPTIVEKSKDKAKRNLYLDTLGKVKFIESDFSPKLLIQGGAFQVFDNLLGLIRPVNL